MVAKDRGIFARHGLDADLVPVTLDSNLPAALAANTIQIAGSTPPIFLHAVDGGLDLVTVAGASVLSAATNDTVAVVAPPGAQISTPADFIGKTVGVPTLGASLHVLFRQWLVKNGVDPEAVTFVEVPFANMAAALSSTSVDALLTADPMLTRIVDSGTGTVVANYLAGFPDGVPMILYATTGPYAHANPAIMQAFRDSIAEAAKIVNAEPDVARSSIASFTRQPPDLAGAFKVGEANPIVDPSKLVWWLEVMKEQDMLRGNIRMSKLVSR